MPLTIDATDTRYVRIPIAAYSQGAAVDTTETTLEVAFPAARAQPSVWHPGSWLQNGVGQILVGPAATVALAAGEYDVWVRVTDTPEVEVARSGAMRVQ